MEADGRAAAIRAQGEAEAEIIFKKGEAEAKAMNVKAEAYQEFNQAAIIDKLITNMPEVVRALAAPLANVDKITIVSTGNGNSAGMHKITGDITEMAARIPAFFVDRAMSYIPMKQSVRQQAEDQTTRVENLKSAHRKWQQKLAEAMSKTDMLVAQQRRSRALCKATDAGRAIGDNSNAAAFDRMKN